MNLPGGSSVFDGMSYLPGLAGTRDTCIFKADGKEGIYTAELALEQLRDYQRELSKAAGKIFKVSSA